jgi:hypothetical protein
VERGRRRCGKGIGVYELTAVLGPERLSLHQHRWRRRQEAGPSADSLCRHQVARGYHRGPLAARLSQRSRNRSLRQLILVAIPGRLRRLKSRPTFNLPRRSCPCSPATADWAVTSSSRPNPSTPSPAPPRPFGCPAGPGTAGAGTGAPGPGTAPGTGRAGPALEPRAGQSAARPAWRRVVVVGRLRGDPTGFPAAVCDPAAVRVSRPRHPAGARPPWRGPPGRARRRWRSS